MAAYRARSLAKGSAITIERNDDKDAVVALREIAEKTIPAGDMREMLIHSIQKQVEIDEPEAVAAPARPSESRPTLGRDDPTNRYDRRHNDRGRAFAWLGGLKPEEPSAKSDAVSSWVRG